MSHPPFPADRWEEKLAVKLEELKHCQAERKLESCLGCSELIGCKLRKEYVNAVYESMSKGQGGGFEF